MLENTNSQNLPANTDLDDFIIFDSVTNLITIHAKKDVTYQLDLHFKIKATLSDNVTTASTNEF